MKKIKFIHSLKVQLNKFILFLAVFSTLNCYSQNIFHRHVDNNPFRSGSFIKDVISENSGKHYVLGTHFSPYNNVWVDNTFINCFDQFGNSIWSKSIYKETMNSIEMHSNGKLITGGRYWYDFYQGTNYLKYYAVSMTDNTTTGNWIVKYGNVNGECYSAKETFDYGASSGIISCGWAAANVNLPTVAKLSNTGVSIWRKRYRNLANDAGTARDICRASNGDFVVAMTFGKDFYIVRLDATNGNLVAIPKRFSLSSNGLVPKKIVKKVVNNVETFVIVGSITSLSSGGAIKSFLCKTDLTNPETFIELNGTGQFPFFEITDLKTDELNTISFSGILTTWPHSVLCKIDLPNLDILAVRKFSALKINAFDNTVPDYYYFQDNQPHLGSPTYDNYLVARDFNGGNCAGTEYSLTKNIITPEISTPEIFVENQFGPELFSEELEGITTTTELICSACSTINLEKTIELCPLYNDNTIWLEPCKLISPYAERYRFVSGPNLDPLNPYDSKTGYYDENNVWHGNCDVSHEFFPGTYVIEFLDYETGCVTHRMTLNIINKSVVPHTDAITKYFCILNNTGVWLNPCELETGYNKYKILDGPNIDPNNPYYSEDGFRDENNVWHGGCDVTHFFEEGVYTLEYYNDDCEKLTLTLTIESIPIDELPTEYITLNKCMYDAIWYQPDLPFSTNHYHLTDPDPTDFFNYTYDGPQISHSLRTGVYEIEFYDYVNCKTMRRIVTVLDMPVTETICTMSYVYRGPCPYWITDLDQFTMQHENFPCICEGQEFEWQDQNGNVINPNFAFQISGSTTFRKVYMNRQTCTRCVYVIRFGCLGQGEFTVSLDESENPAFKCVISPNPSDDIYNIKFSGTGDVKTFNLEVIDVMGKIIISKPGLDGSMPQAIDLSTYASGVYTLRIEMNGQVQFIKLIKN